MSTLYTTTGSINDIQIDTWRAGPDHDELLDGTLVTSFETDGLVRTRLAVFDPAENLTLANCRQMCHHAVAVARKHFGQHPNPTVAVTETSKELHNPQLAVHMENHLTTAVWADISHQDGKLVLHDAGICGDGEIAIQRQNGRLEHLGKTTLWTPEAGERWMRWVNETWNHQDWVQLWEERAKYVDQPEHYMCTPLGMFGHARPEHIDTSNITLEEGDQLIVATDGAELETANSPFDMRTWLDGIIKREPKPDGYVHGDIAAIRASV